MILYIDRCPQLSTCPVIETRISTPIIRIFASRLSVLDIRYKVAHTKDIGSVGVVEAFDLFELMSLIESIDNVDMRALAMVYNCHGLEASSE